MAHISAPPTRKFQPGDEVEATLVLDRHRRYYILAYTRTGKIIIEDELGVTYGDYTEGQLEHKRSLESIITKAFSWIEPGCVHRITTALREAGAIKDGW